MNKHIPQQPQDSVMLDDDQPLQQANVTDPFYYLSTHFVQRKDGYHRSKVYSPNHHGGQHSLVAAAGPIFALIHRLNRSATQNTSIQMSPEHWQHEMQAFIDHATASGYNDKTIAGASFALTALIDESLKVSHEHEPISENKTLLPEAITAKHQADLFFDLIAACQIDQENHLDLIELLYLCIENGYTGHYAHHEQGLHQLSQINHQLFTIIQKHKAKSPPAITATAKSKTKTTTQRATRKPTRWPSILLCLCCSVIGFYGGQHHKSSAWPPQPISQHTQHNTISTLS